MATSTTGSGAGRISGHWSFVVALWIALSTALFSAVPSAGLPSSKTVGSAFDPSTTSVAVRARGADRAGVLLARDRLPDPDTAAAGSAGALIVAPVVADFPRAVAPDAPITPILAMALPHPLIGLARPRGPPVL